VTDPLSEVVTLLQPEAAFSKVVNGAGRWRVRRTELGRPFYCVVLEGSCRLVVEGREPLALQANDFVLIPAAHNFTTTSNDPPDDHLDVPPTALPGGEFRLGTPEGPPQVRMVVGYCVFGSPDAAMLVSLLPQLVHVRGEQRLATLVHLVREESRGQRPARELILTRLLEVLLLEALRSSAGTAASSGLLRGLADDRLAAAIKRMHERPTHAWTVAQLANEAALSRSAFFERFSRVVGMTPMAYLLAWRMALARKLLRNQDIAIADVAERVGYSSASTFSVAFTRHVGVPPTRYAAIRSSREK
jgi:AraC-like DNA-binding protein